MGIHLYITEYMYTHTHTHTHTHTLIWASLVTQMVKNLPAMQETQVQSLGWGTFPGE